MRKIRGIPVIGELIRAIADQFRPISQEIDALLLAMDSGIVRLDENNAAAMAQSDELKRLIEEVALKAYAAELIFTRLKDQAASAPRDLHPRITNAMSRVGKRALFLMGNEQVFLQVLTGLRTSITTNLELRDTVAMMRDQAVPLLTNLIDSMAQQSDHGSDSRLILSDLHFGHSRSHSLFYGKLPLLDGASPGCYGGGCNFKYPGA